MRVQVCRQTLNGGRFPSPCLQQAGRSQRAPRGARHQRQLSHSRAPASWRSRQWPARGLPRNLLAPAPTQRSARQSLLPGLPAAGGCRLSPTSRATAANGIPACSRQVPAQAQHQGLKQLRETAELARPRRLHQPHRAVRQFHPRHTHFKKTLMLKKVQVPIAFGLRVVHRVLTCRIRVNEAAARAKIHKNRQRPARLVKARLNHIPRRTHTKCRFKKLFRFHCPTCLLQAGRLLLTDK